MKIKAPVAAEKYLHEYLLIGEKNLPDDVVLFLTEGTLGGEALTGQRKFMKAEPLLLQGHERMEQSPGAMPPDETTFLPVAIRRLVDRYTAWDKPDEAAKWQKELDSL